MSQDLEYFAPRDEREVLDFVINDFPFPLALTYSRLQQEMDRQQPIAAAWQLRDAFEVLVKFSAILATSDALVNSRDTELVGELAGTLLAPQGLSLGHWHSLLDTALASLKPFARENRLRESGRRVPDLFGVFYEHEHRIKRNAVSLSISGNAESFIAWRNRVFGHGVFQEEREWYAAETRRMLEPLHRFYKALRPVLDQWQMVSEESGGGYAVWHGDNQLPLVARHEHESRSEPVPIMLLPRGTDDAQPLPLVPLLSIQRCDVCGQKSVFFFDKRKSRNNAIVLEYARGHHRSSMGWTEIAKLAELAPPKFIWERSSYDSKEISASADIVFRDFDREYQRPAYLLEAVWRVFDRQERGYVHVTGPEGTGKTFLVRGLEAEAAERQAVVLPYLIRRGALTDAMTFLNELHLVASEKLPARTPAPQLLVQDIAGLREQFTAYVRELVTANNLDTLVIAIDALDELQDPEPGTAAITDVLPAPDALPEGCFFLLTSRSQLRPAVRNGIQRIAAAAGEVYTPIGLDPGAAANQDLVRTYLGRNLPEPYRTPDHVATVLERSGSVFLYAGHLAHALASGVFQTATALPAAGDFYPAYLARIRERVGDEIFETAYLTPLLLLAAAQQPVTLDQLVRWGSPRGRLEMALFDLRDFLRVRRVSMWHDSLTASEDQRYELAHEAFSRFVRHDPALCAKYLGAHETIARQALNALDGHWHLADPYDAGDLYALGQLPVHLREGRLAQLEAALLEDEGYARACWSAGDVAWKLGRSEIALHLYGRAVDVYRYLVVSRARGELANDLARALMNRGVALRGLGRLAEATAAYEEAIAIRRELVTAGRGELANDLAGALVNKAIALERIGDAEVTLDCYREAIACREQCVTSGMSHILPELIRTLRYRMMTLIELRQWEAVSSDVVRAMDHAFPEPGMAEPLDNTSKEFADVLQVLAGLAPEALESVAGGLGRWENPLRHRLNKSREQG